MKNWVKELRKMLGDDICLCIAGMSALCLLCIKLLLLYAVLYTNIQRVLGCL